MNRLTTHEEYPHGAEGKSVDRLTGCWCRGKFEATACVEKLSRYEDTGLEPEEIMDGKMLTGWIPAAEKLPKAKEDVLVCTKFGWILVAWYGPNGQRWHITPADAGITREDIAAWMPLPKPFNPQNEDLVEDRYGT